MDPTAYELAIIAGGFGIAGTLIGVLGTYLLGAVACLLGWLIYAYCTNLFAEGNGAKLSRSVFVAGLAIWFSLRTSKRR